MAGGSAPTILGPVNDEGEGDTKIRDHKRAVEGLRRSGWSPPRTAITATMAMISTATTITAVSESHTVFHTGSAVALLLDNGAQPQGRPPHLQTHTCFGQRPLQA